MEDMTLDIIIEKTKNMLGKNYRGTETVNTHDTSPQEENDGKFDILKDVCEMVVREAAEWTNRKINAELLNECWPVIVKCSCVAYLNRGAEGLGSQSELGQQNVYNDWIALMHKQITNRRYVI